MKINQNLLEKLFERPNPQPEKPEVLRFFSALHYRMFPEKERFVGFLTAQSIDKQYENAIEIIQSLCYHSNFPPSIFSVFDVQTIENWNKKNIDERSQYMPRDHFIHLINIYLLGLYIFFYDEIFYMEIVAQNRYKRNDVDDRNTKLNCIKDFISEWKYFSMCHDIGYSAEIIGKNANTSKWRSDFGRLREEMGFSCSFRVENILSEHAFLGSAEVVAKIIACHIIMNYSTTQVQGTDRQFEAFRCEELQFSSNSEKEFGDIEPYIKNKRRMEKVYSNQCLKVLLPIIGSEHIFVVGSLKDTGKVLFLSYFSTATRRREVVILSSDVRYAEGLSELLDRPEITVFDDYSPDEFELEYFFDDISHYNNNLFDPSELEAITEYFDRELGLNCKAIYDETGFFEFQYKIYRYIYKYLKQMIAGSCLEKKLLNERNDYKRSFEERTVKKIEYENEIYQIVKAKYIYHLNEMCSRYIAENINVEEISYDDGKRELREIADEFGQRYLEQMRNLIEDSQLQEMLSDNMLRDFKKSFRNEILLLKLYVNVYMTFISILSKVDIGFNYDYETAELNYKSDFLNKVVEEKIKLYFQQLDEDIKNADELMKRYKYPYGNTTDHGECSAKYIASIFDMYHYAFRYAEGEKEKSALSILLDIGDDFDSAKKKYSENYKHIFSEVLFAILVHNLYPECFESDQLREYRTSIKNPFCYLALLSDSLQEWNRPESAYVPMMLMKQNRVVSEDYNVVVKEGKICIYEGDDGRVQDLIREKIIKLGDYLEDPEIFVQVGY